MTREVVVTREEILEQLGLPEETLFLDPPLLDEAIVGAMRCNAGREGQRHVLLYDEEMVLERLRRGAEDEFSYESAREYFEFNTIGAWMGQGTPAFVTFLPPGERTIDVEATKP